MTLPADSAPTPGAPPPPAERGDDPLAQTSPGSDTPLPEAEDPFVFGVDIDGVLADYTYAFGRAVAAERNLDHASLPPQTNWDFADWGIESREEYDDLHRKAVLDHRIFLHCPVIAGAAEALWRLSDAGVWIRLITHRIPQNWGHAVAVSDTVTWLDNAGIPYRDLCFLGRKPEVEADSYIDDAPHNVEGLRRRGNHVIVFDQPYNRDIDGPRATSWREVEEIIGSRVVELGKSFQGELPGLDSGTDRLRGRIDKGRNGAGEDSVQDS